jgi:non-specific serine/threonine protein kinase/serine/threonine-protein kinase
MHSTDSNPNDATEFVNQGVVADADCALQPGMQLGAYVIRGVLGEGGMGRVYLAEQMRPVHREVALKLIREQVASPLARAYFDVERQALAQMQHPSIAQVFDAGTTEQGYPYLAMELVEGVAITRFCREQHLSEDQRLALFARVCHGVQHAHQKGIIHRDLKPANVLVRRIDGTPEPKIIDFGIAIGGGAPADGAAARVANPDRAGTVVYMSPEQALHSTRDLDTRSDVYSLGVMLYEVLTDADAAELTSLAHHSTRAPQQTLMAAIAGELDSDGAPGTTALLEAARRLPHELRAILRKALAVDRTERYDSAAALGDDLQRYRENRPVKALPPTRGYLLRTFAARHRLGIVAASLAAAALIAGTALALAGLARAQKSAEVARSEAAKAAQVSDFVRGMLAGIDPDRAKGMDRSLMRMVLDSAAGRAGRELEAQPDVRAEIELTIADSYSSLGEFALAGTHYDAALDAARNAKLPPQRVGEMASRRALGIGAAGHPQDSLVAATEAFAIVTSLPEDDRGRLRVESRLAAAERDAGKLEPARARFERVRTVQARVLGADDPDTLESEQGLGIANFVAGRFDDARPLLQDVIARYRQRYGAEDMKTIGATISLAVLENEQERYGETEKLLTPVLPLVEKIYGPEHPRTLVVVMNLGSAMRYQNHYEEARPYYLRAFDLARKLYGPTAPRTLMAEGNLSAMLSDAHDLTAAESHARHVADNAQAAFGDNPYRAAMYRGLAKILLLQGRYPEAEAELQRAWTIFSDAKEYGAGHPRSQEVVDTFIELYAAWKKPELEALWRSRKVAPAVAAG